MVVARQAQAEQAALITLDQFAATYIERGPQASGKTSWRDDRYLLTTVRDHRTPGGRRFTPREAQFAVALSEGESPGQVAETQRLTRATARWRTEQIRKKTNSRTQAQSVAVILQSLAALRRRSD